MGWFRNLFDVPSFLEINEHAIDRGIYSSRVEARVGQLAENLSLVVYCKLFDKTNRNLNHWKGELFAHISSLGKTSLKNFSNKRPVLEKILINKWELNTQDGMMAEAIEKFAKEHIEWTEELDKAFLEASKLVPKMIDLIVDGNSSTIKSWVYSL